jgi:acetyl-CoA decarbonylase/synthase complex subunit beta
VDPKGPVFEIPQGKVIDAKTGEYEGVNQVIQEKSLGEVERVQLYTTFGYPHTSCGCFEGCAFLIPEVDGFGVVHRNFKGETVNGLNFVTISDLTAGGKQIDGFHGLSIEYMRSQKFLDADGGWDRVVWMPHEIKERIKDFMPPEIIPLIPTESDVTDLAQLKTWLTEKNHPIVERWSKEPEVAPAETGDITVPTLELPASAIPIQGIPSGMGFTIILKNAKIKAEKMIIKADKER